jgi:site-specific recombinase XerD
MITSYEQKVKSLIRLNASLDEQVEINLKESSILIHGKGGKTRVVYISESALTQLSRYINGLKESIYLT